MPFEGVFSTEEQRAVVLAYLAVPHGSKGRFLTDRGVSENQLYRWRARLFADTVEYGLTPRSEAVSVEQSAALARALAEVEALREQLAERDAAHERDLAARDEELARQRRVVDALGKAIEILQHDDAGKIAEPEASRLNQPRPHRK